MPKIPADFARLTAALGSDPLQVQGAGGNTSWKTGDVMWVKASGTKLADAEQADIFVAVSVERARAQIDGDGDGTCVSAKLDASPLRPSIETTFHAVLPCAAVVHTHSVTAIAHASCSQGRAALASKFSGLNWALVPYRRPGLPLTRAIREVLADPPADVLVLANHGLIVCANSVTEVAALLEEAQSRMSLPCARALCFVPDDEPPEGWSWQPEFASLACDPRLAKLASAGSYYPDHVVFLGPALTCVPDMAGARQKLATLESPAMLVSGTGVLIRRDAAPGAAAMLGCLRDVLMRLPEGWKLDSLDARQETELLGWDAEKYRQELARR